MAEKFLYPAILEKPLEPTTELGVTPLDLDYDTTLTDKQLSLLLTQLINNFGEVAPDLKSNHLATRYTEPLFNKLISKGAKTLRELQTFGQWEFYNVGRYVLGPLAVSFVDTILKDTSNMAVFPARDATPFYYAAKALKTLNPTAYSIQDEAILNPVFNRKLWGVEDEQDPENEVLLISHPLVQKLLSQLGFGKTTPTFVEVGCWGTMVDSLKSQMPEQPFSVYFLYTHLPEYIFGFINIYGKDLPEPILETVADTWEAFPKFYKRPTKLVEENGIVKASLEGKVVKSPFLEIWSNAALEGVTDAAKDFISNGKLLTPHQELLRLWELSDKAKAGIFTGVLPDHTETWTEGLQWKNNWKWGKIPPLK